MITEGFWTDIEDRRPRGAGLVRRRVRPESQRNIFLGVLYPSRNRVLVLVVADAAAQTLELPQTRSLASSIQAADEQGMSEVRVELRAPEMAVVFNPFCDDVISAIAVADSDAAAVRALLDRIAHWKKLLALGDSTLLSPAAAQALYGELWVLRHVIEPICGTSSVAAWQGPDREMRDFLHDGFGVEVKTTSGGEPSAVTITSERQLDSAGLSRLYLVALKLETLRGGNGENLNQAVAATLGLFQGPHASDLADKLRTYGYHDIDVDRYAAVQYAVREVVSCEVQETFPRIVESDLSPGVGRVSYSLALSACEAWRCDLGELQLALRQHVLRP